MQFSRYRFTRFEFRRPRNPLLRLAVGLLGAAVMALLLVFGLFIGLAMLAFVAARRIVALLLTGQATRPRRPVAQPGDVLEGEYDVVHKSHDPLPR